MRASPAIVAGLIASVLTAVTFSSCHVRFVSFSKTREGETISMTDAVGLARDYRCVRTLLPVWCPLLSRVPGEVAVATDTLLASHFHHFGGRIWIPALRPNWTWLAPLASWLLLVHAVGAFAAGAFVRWRGRLIALRRGGPSACVDRAAVPAAVTTAAVYVAVAPFAAAASWFFTFDVWWPGILNPREAFPSLLGAALCAMFCLVPALGAGWAAARIASLCRIPPDRGGRSRRCARCGYDPGRVTSDVCPECGATAGQRWWLRRAAALLVAWPSRLALYIMLIGGLTVWMYIWAFGPPQRLLPEPNPYLRPKYTILVCAFSGAYDAQITWGNGPEPTLITWADGTLLYAESIEGFGSADPLRITWATAWLASGLDEGDPANWRFERHEETFAAGTTVAQFRVLPEDEKSRYEWRLTRDYTIYIGDVSQAWITGRATAIEKVGPRHRLASIGEKLLGMLEPKSPQ